ncbi:MAG: 23S rRNA (uracil(1939)-C(5))-methyltransferase RlmD, partial [Oscillospiraceae bacterium]|nr:23S rRNA (uracil(1939)-C(5))-methyltransferase RlmD [Oscillospiraceae bacterium]
MKKNDIVTIDITDTTAEGSGVGRVENMVVFVQGAFTGDKLKAKIIKCTKKYCIGKIEELIVPSKSRTDCVCEAFPRCGGCMFPHISYDAELEMKRRWVEENFRRIGGFEIDVKRIVASPNTEGYRNKGIYPVTKDENGAVRAGFYARHSHRIAGKAECALHPAFFGDIVKEVTAFLKEENISIYDEESKKGLVRSIFIRHGEISGDTMVCLVVNGDSIPKEELLAQRLAKIPQVTGVVINTNTTDGNVLLGEKCRTVSGQGHITDTLRGLKFNIAPTAFYQVNRRGAELLYGIAEDYAAPEGGLLIDLYCGAGTIGLSMAKRAERVIGAEIVPSAVDNAKENAKRNGVANAEFILADAGEAAVELEKRGEHPQVVILDPPRAGCSAEAIEAVVRMAPDRVVMVSCNSATAARDAKLFAELGYHPREITAVDMFPRTGHVETVVLLSREKADDYVR